MATGAERSQVHRDRKRRGILAVVKVEITPEIRKSFDLCGMFDHLEDGKVSNDEYAYAAQAWVEVNAEQIIAGETGQ